DQRRACECTQAGAAMTMTCTACEALWFELLDGDLDAGEAASVRAHLGSCAACAKGYADLEAALRAVEAASPEGALLEAPPPNVDHVVLRAAEAQAAVFRGEEAPATVPLASAARPARE